MKLICLTILSFFFESYIVLYLSIVLHEIAHFTTAKLIGFSDVFLCIGFYGVLGLTGTNYFISPLALSGYVSVDTEALRNMNKLKQACFWMSGIFVNLVGVIVGILSGNGIITFINSVIVLLSGVPIPLLKNDMFCFLTDKKYRG